MQDFILRPLIGFMAVYGVMMAYLLARRLPILMPGLAGGFAVIILANFFGQVRARASFMEIGFSGEFFYMRSAYDLAHDGSLKYYPLAYANAAREGDMIVLNYIDRPVRLRFEDWGEALNEIWMKLNGF